MCWPHRTAQSCPVPVTYPDLDDTQVAAQDRTQSCPVPVTYPNPDDTQVYAMDKRLLDPRRARRAPTAEDRAEQLAPYAEELPVAAGGYATFDAEVAGLRGVPRRASGVSGLVSGRLCHAQTADCPLAWCAQSTSPMCARWALAVAPYVRCHQRPHSTIHTHMYVSSQGALPPGRVRHLHALTKFVR